jgi:hypothetical protein
MPCVPNASASYNHEYEKGPHVRVVWHLRLEFGAVCITCSNSFFSYPVVSRVGRIELVIDDIRTLLRYTVALLHHFSPQDVNGSLQLANVRSLSNTSSTVLEHGDHHRPK